MNHYDYHATLLHLFGLDNDRLPYKPNNQGRSLIEGDKSRVVDKILV